MRETRSSNPTTGKGLRWVKAAAAISVLLLIAATTPADARWRGLWHVPAAPDYAMSDAWLSRPATPAHNVAVFYIHPTSYFAPFTRNARYDQKGLAARLNRASMRFQAAVFAGCCDIWAPQYRQASLKAIVTNSDAAYAVDDIAYDDIAHAFQAFVSGIRGRPFILAAHSQGSIQALRLLDQRIIGTPLQRRLIAAYLPGLALPKKIASRGLSVCQTAASTDCIVSWNTVRAGYNDRRRRQDAVIWWNGRYQPVAGRLLVCVNPVDWRPGGVVNSPGGISVYVVHRGGPPSSPVAALERVECQRNGLLGIIIKAKYKSHFTDFLSRTGVYHDFDYNLFFASIARNARRRIASFERGK